MGKMITLKASDGHEFSAYRADPAAKPKGCMIVIQEIFGVNDHIRSVADRVAANGFLAVAPCMQDRAQKGFEVGYTPADIEKGKEMRMKVKNEDSLKDLQATFDYLKSQNAGKIGAVGYCWGGSLAWLAATHIDGLACAVSYYGGEVSKSADAKAKCPVIFHFGDKDMSIPMDQIEIVKAKQGATNPVYVYAAGHGFSCDARGSFDKAAHELALGRTREFAMKHLG